MASAEGDAPARPWELVFAGTVYRWLGVRRQHARTLTVDRRFPAPWLTSEDGKTRLWRRALVVAWFETHRPERAAELDESEPGWRGQG